MSDLKQIAADVRSAARWIDDSCGESSEIGTELHEHADALDALAAQEPVSKVIVCPVCYSKEVASDFLDGETSCGDCCAVWNERKRVAQSIVSEMQNELDFLRAEVEVLRKQLHLANIDACNAEAELNSAAPQPSAQEPVAAVHGIQADYLRDGNEFVGVPGRYAQAGDLLLYAAPTPAPVPVDPAGLEALRRDAACFQWLMSLQSGRPESQIALAQVILAMRKNPEAVRKFIEGQIALAANGEKGT